MSQVSKQSAQQAEFIGTKINSIWTFKTSRMAKMFDCSAPPFKGELLVVEKTSQVSKQLAQQNEFIGTKISSICMFKTCKMAKMLQLFSPNIQRRTVGHRKMSQVSKWSAQQAEFIGTKISSIWTFKMCRMAKMFDYSTPLFKAVNLPIQHHNIHQNVQLNKQIQMHPSRPSQQSWQPRQQCSQPKTITQKEQIKELYADVFEGIGHFPGQPYHINLDQSVTPVYSMQTSTCTPERSV